MVERSLSMREVPGSIPGASTSFYIFHRFWEINNFYMHLPNSRIFLEYLPIQGPRTRGGPGGVGPPLESGIYVVKNFLKIFLIYSDPPWIKIVPWPLNIDHKPWTFFIGLFPPSFVLTFCFCIIIHNILNWSLTYFQKKYLNKRWISTRVSYSY